MNNNGRISNVGRRFNQSNDSGARYHGQRRNAVFGRLRLRNHQQDQTDGNNYKNDSQSNNEGTSSLHDNSDNVYRPRQRVHFKHGQQHSKFKYRKILRQKT
jgi:hypothetical protein